MRTCLTIRCSQMTIDVIFDVPSVPVDVEFSEQSQTIGVGFDDVKVIYPSLEPLSVTPTEEAQTFTPTPPVSGYSGVSVGAIPSQYKDTSDATATAQDVVEGQTAYANGAKITGSMTAMNTPTVGATSYDDTMSNVYVLYGQHDWDERICSLNGRVGIVFPRAMMGNALSDKVLQGYTFTSAEGVAISGNIPTLNGRTITPTTTDQTITGGEYLGGDIVVQGDPNLNLNNIMGGVSIFGVEGYPLNKNTVITPIGTEATGARIRSGYKAWANGQLVTGSIPDLAATTYTPTTADQTIAAGSYIAGVQTILGDANLLPENIKEGISLFNVLGTAPTPYEYVSTLYDKTFNLKSDTTFDTWTASTTASAIMATANAATFVADMVNYEYLILWETACPIAFKSGATLKTIPIWEGAAQFHAIFRRANSLANIAADNREGNAAVNVTNAPLEEYWNSSGSHTYTYSTSYGLYPAVQTPTFSSATADNPTVTVKRPTFNARCSSTYFATARKADIDSENTYFRMRCRLFRQRMVQFGSYQAYGYLNNLYTNLTPVT